MSLAAWHKRKYEPLAASVLLERHGPVAALPGRLEQNRVMIESTPRKTLEFQTPAAILAASVALTG